MLLKLALLLLPLAALAHALARLRRSRPHRVTRSVRLGFDAAKYRKGQKLLLDGKRREALRVAEVDAEAGVVTFEALPPPTASQRKAGPKEAALLRAMGYDPAVYDCAPVSQPWPGLQVFRGGERVRFFTAKQVKARESQWRTALRTGRLAATEPRHNVVLRDPAGSRGTALGDSPSPAPALPSAMGYVA